MDFELSDSDSHSESSSSEDQDDLESIYGGQARNIFSRLDEIIENIDDFLFSEPQFHYGDIVHVVSDTSGKMGKVINMDMVVDLENTYGSKIHNINAKYLEKIRPFSVGDVVACGLWLGRVERIADTVTILFDSGRKNQLCTAGSKKIVPISPDIVEDPRYPFYPGQRVQVESSVSDSTHWLCGSRRGKLLFGTVCNIDAGLVFVEWLDCVVINGEKQPAPLHLQNPKNLTLLSCFSPTNWQLGDWCVLPNEQSFPSDNTSNLVQEHKKSGVVNENMVFNLSVQEIAVIVKTKTKVDVLWQDGSLSRALETHLLRSVNVLDIHDFWPDTIVLEKVTAGDSQASGTQAWGIVKCADSKERTVKVKWCKSHLKEQFDGGKPMEETVSAYELIEHPHYSYSLGDIVFRKDECDGVDLANKTVSKVCMDEASNLENCRDGTEHLLDNGLCYIGVVAGLKNGNIEVKWASGATTEVAPYEIYQADKCEGTTSTSLQTSENLQHSNEGTQAKESQLLEQKVLLGLDCDDLKESSSQFLPQAATKFFTNLFQSLSTVFVGTHQGTYEDVPSLGKSVDDNALELCNLNSGCLTPVIDDSWTQEEATSEKSVEVNEDSSFLSCSKKPECFSRFNMVIGCSDHHFVNESGTGQQYFQMKRGWLKKVTQEWSILEENLPETIYVRAYEDKMQLLRAAIVGSAGTPYHDGLFFFDIYLPPQYPNDPPMVHYHSGGLRINPNLYESGKICLSLLNTWTGSNTEVWDPESSTTLQLLLSLQALVLNDKPYFNEAGYDSQVGKPEAEKNSINYNENTFLVSCSSMLYLLRNPPEHFEELVKEHFRRRCSQILLACKAYMDGATIGYPFVGSVNAQEVQTGNSTGFKIMLGKLYPKLEEAFSALSGECSKMPDHIL